jgi:hypothetical protein
MPVEEAGNMLIMTGAVAFAEGNADYARLHWDALSAWAAYLKQEGVDPGYQLTTDDFAGNIAHSANLSAKLIVGLAAYGKLAGMLGYMDVADEYAAAARQMASQWIQRADNGDHYRLAFDQPDTWSQKYNLIWDKALQLNLFPDEVFAKESAYYLTRLNPYGLPLDNRASYTIIAWNAWTACFGDNPGDFQQLMAGVYRYATATPTRYPLPDWYHTDTGEAHMWSPTETFRARSVVGGCFMKLWLDKH